MKTITIIATASMFFLTSCEQCVTCRFSTGVEQEYCSADPDYIDNQEEACSDAGGIIL